MTVRATRLSGALIAGAGGVFLAYFLVGAGASPELAYWLLQSYPIGLSTALVAVGVLLARGRLVADRFVRRLLAWMGVGIVVFSLLVVWFYLFAIVIYGRALLDNAVGIVTIPVLGALVGLLVGTYDARAVEGRQAVERLSKINEALRVATGELVERRDRDALEAAVCERLVESDSLVAAWIGRYDADDRSVCPVAWAGFDGDLGSLVVDVADGGAAESVWSRVVRTEEGQVLGTVRAAGPHAVGPWGDRFDRHGVESVAVVPIVDGDAVYGLLAVCADAPDAFDGRQRAVFAELGETVGHAIASIRVREALEARERDLVDRNDRLDEFAGVVSHDLRNPLNVILGRVALLRETGEHDELDAIERAARRMEEIVTNLLALSRLSRDRVDPEPVSLAAVADESWRTVATGDSEFDLRVPETTTVRADPPRLRTVFENLFRNASEHNDAPLTVRVGMIEAAVGAADAGSAGFFVEDDGGGIPGDERGEVFDHGYTTNPDGTGFGLSIVRGVVDSHDWEIDFREGRAGGARIEITGVERDESSVELDG